MTAASPNHVPNPQQEAAQHLSDARRLLLKLREEMKNHPEFELALEKLEMALSSLTVNTGGML